MPTTKEISDSIRETFGVGTKNFETVSRGKKGSRQDKTVCVIAVVNSAEDIEKVRKTIDLQTYKNVVKAFVINDQGLIDNLKNEDIKINGIGFFDAAVYFGKTDGFGDMLFAEFIVDNFWMPGHLESLVEVAEDGVPVASAMRLHELAGWDGLTPDDYEFVAAECVLWKLDELKSWESDDEFRAVDNLLKDDPPIVRTNKPTVVLQA